MKVIVITIVKNDLTGLIKTQESIRGQTSPVTWWLVTPNDDSPTFRHANQSFAAGEVHRVIFDQGRGIYNAMNLAIHNVLEEDWIWFLNAGDEFATPTAYALVSLNLQLTSAKWIFGGHLLGSTNGKILGEVPSPQEFRPDRQLYSKNHISHQSTIFKVELLKKLDGFNEEFKMAADWDLMVRASKLDPGLCLPVPLSIFYMGGYSTQLRSLGNSDLLKLRNKYLGVRHIPKSYSWFYYRTIRNLLVQSVEEKFPHILNNIRAFRLKKKNNYSQLNSLEREFPTKNGSI